MDSTLAKLALIAIALGMTTAIVMVLLIALGRWRSPGLSHNSMDNANQVFNQISSDPRVVEPLLPQENT
jgi:hypothetical protein